MTSAEFEKLINEHKDKLYRFAFSILKNSNDSQDAVQEVVLRLWNNRRSLDALLDLENSWKGKHYFMPFENNDSTLNAFTNKNISSLCSGGVNYAIRKSDGSIITNVDSPLKLLNGDAVEYLKEFVYQ